LQPTGNSSLNWQRPKGYQWSAAVVPNWISIPHRTSHTLYRSKMTSPGQELYLDWSSNYWYRYTREKKNNCTCTWYAYKYTWGVRVHASLPGTRYHCTIAQSSLYTTSTFTTVGSTVEQCTPTRTVRMIIERSQRSQKGNKSVSLDPDVFFGREPWNRI
jgi:hypothetical protein